MQTRTVPFAAAASALFLLTGIQSLKADTVPSVSIVIEPYNNEKFYLSNPEPGSEMTIGAESYTRQIYKNTDPDGSPAKAVEIKGTYTLTHATSGGVVQTANSDDSFMVTPGATQTVAKEVDASAVFGANMYTTRIDSGMRAILATKILSAAGTDSNNWTVYLSWQNPNPSGPACNPNPCNPGCNPGCNPTCGPICGPVCGPGCSTGSTTQVAHRMIALLASAFIHIIP